MGVKGYGAVILILSLAVASTVKAQISYNLVSRDIVQRRLNLYKGNDTTREAALKKLFAEAGCSAENLSEQPVPGRKQPILAISLLE